MEHQRGFQRDCHPVREDEESLLDVEDVQACPTIWHIADVTQANWNTNKDRLAGPERQASDRSAPGGPWTIGRHIQRLACGRQRPPGRDAGLFWPRGGGPLSGDGHWPGIPDALGHGEDAALRRYVDVPFESPNVLTARKPTPTGMPGKEPPDSPPNTSGWYVPASTPVTTTHREPRPPSAISHHRRRRGF